MTINLGAGVVAADENVVVDNQFGILLLEDLGPIPSSSEVIALEVDTNGDRLLAFETTTVLTGGVVARPGDIVRYDGGGVYSIEFDASAAGLPSTVAIDALSINRNQLYLSFDTTVDLGNGLVVADEDIVSWNGSQFRMILDGSSVGIDSALDIDAIQYLDVTRFLISFDTSGQVGGVVFDDEDVLRWAGLWVVAFDASAANSAWEAADMDALVVPEPELVGMIGVGCGLLVGLKRRRRARPKGGPRELGPKEESACEQRR